MINKDKFSNIDKNCKDFAVQNRKFLSNPWQ